MRLLLVAVIVVLLGDGAPYAQQPATHPLTGRQIAGVMGVGGADWLDRSEREVEEAPEKALDLIGIRPGETVADIGAGSGYYTMKLARRVGPAGRVIANDIQPGMLEIIRRRVDTLKLANVDMVLGEIDDPKLPARSIDTALLVDVYHELSEPQRMLRKIREALKPDGRLVLLEFKKEDPAIPIRFEHKMSVSEAKREVEAEGFRLERTLGDLPWQHVLIYRKQEVP